jgi:NAD(P)-dependent dehydrogenase (short-subunit alcohol dehydrogenase family)
MEPSLEDLLARYEGALEGRRALVTGAGSGIGRAIAVAFAGAGADVALVGRREQALSETAELVEQVGARALVLPADVTDPESLDRVVSRARDELGAASIAVANAGIDAWADLQELDPARLRSALATNTEGVANLARSVVPSMREQGGGKLIVVASDNGRRAEAGGSGYVASKFAAVGLSLALSLELMEDDIGVHVIEPGAVDTEWYPPDEDAPRDRMLRAGEVALVALFLATLPRGVVLDEILMLPAALVREPWD